MERASLYGCWAKLQRANENLLYLQTLVAVSAANKEHGIIGQEDPSGLVVFRLVFPYWQRLRWAVLVGEIAHDLRSALDHLVSQLVILSGGIPTRGHEFPIFIDPLEYRQKGIPRLAGISTEAQARIEGLQPYHAGDQAASHPLWLLSEISNQDKHRLLTLAFLRITGADVTITSLKGDTSAAVPFSEPGLADTKLGAFEDRADWASIAFVTQREMKVDYKFTVSVAFADAGPATGKPVTKTLDALSNFVVTTLDRDFLPLFPDPPAGWPRSPLISD